MQPDCLKGRVVCGTVWGHALKRSPGINRKRRVSYPGPGFLSSATWPSLPKMPYNGLNQTMGKDPNFKEKYGINNTYVFVPIYQAPVSRNILSP